MTVDPKSKEDDEGFAKRLIEEQGIQGVGGFSLSFGTLRKAGNGDSARLAFISNRTPNARGLQYSKPGTWGLSNSHFGDRAWPKVVNGEKLLDEAIQRNLSENTTSEEFINKCFEVLSTDTLPKQKAGEGYQTYTYQLRNSIFIPAFGNEHKEEQAQPPDEVAAAKTEGMTNVTGTLYGTQKQTVILVDYDGHVFFRERTVYGADARPLPLNERDVTFEFDIDGWKG